MTISKYSIIGGVTFGMIVGLVFVFILTQTTKNPSPVAILPTPISQVVASPLPTATPIASPTVPDSIAVPNQGLAPDGKQTLNMITEPAGAGQTAYSFFVRSAGISDPASPSGKLIFTITVATPITLSVPFNTWSPSGNQYVFIQEHEPTITHNFVFKANGAQFANGSEFLDINNIFDQKKTGFLLGEVTGWASPTLLVVNSKKADGTAGPSFWVDVTSRSVMRLSTTFP